MGEEGDSDDPAFPASGGAWELCLLQRESPMTFSCMARGPTS